MASSIFDRETLLDLSVNIIPLFIIVFFFGLFILLEPFSTDPVETVLQMALLIVPFVSLAVVTYFSGRAITRDERKSDAITEDTSIERTESEASAIDEESVVRVDSEDESADSDSDEDTEQSDEAEEEEEEE